MPAASAKSLLAVWAACQRHGLREELSRSLSASDIERLSRDWLLWARSEQLPPPVGGAAPDRVSPWFTWLFLGGRGAGKTRAGAEWVRGAALGVRPFAPAPVGRIALVGETFDQARAVMIEGVSGLLAVHHRDERPKFFRTKRELRWPNGALAQVFSADDPESLRGPQFEAAWCDELAKWRYAEKAWDMLQFGLRLGAWPRQLVTTTPRALPLLKRILADPHTVVTRAGTEANAANLAPRFLEDIVARYRGTRLGRQELDGELIEDRPDALWRRAVIEAQRVDGAPPLARIVVAIDPPATSGRRANACGLIGAGVDEGGRAYVLADATLERARPHLWAAAAARLYHQLSADCVVAEVNQGGEMVAEMLRQVEPGLPLRLVRAARGKHVRAEPVAALYEQGRVFHVGMFPELEDQMCDFGPTGFGGPGSPDRVDALVWALTELVSGGRPAPRVRVVG